MVRSGKEIVWLTTIIILNLEILTQMNECSYMPAHTHTERSICNINTEVTHAHHKLQFVL